MSTYNSTKPSPKYRHVMCFGTFDIFHPGHMYYLHEASRLAQYITIIVARDERVIQYKGKAPLHNEQERVRRVGEEVPRASVRLGHEHDIYAPIREVNPDILAFGYDQYVPEEDIRTQFPDIHIVRLGSHAPDKFKSSLLRDQYESK